MLVGIELLTPSKALERERSFSAYISEVHF